MSIFLIKMLHMLKKYCTFVSVKVELVAYK